MNYTETFKDYAAERGYFVKPESILHRRTGVIAVVQSDDENVVDLTHFTDGEHLGGSEKTIAVVRLAFVDFGNEDITDGLIDVDDECDHSDKRVCEMAGHAIYSEDGQSGPF